MAPAPAEAEKPPDRVVFIGRLTRQEVIAGQVNNVARHILPRVLAFYFGLLIACCTLAILHGGIGQLQSLHMIEFFGGAALALCVLLLVLVELRCWRARDQTSDTAVCLTPDHVSLTRPGDSIVTLPAARFRFYRISQGVVGEFGRKSWIFLPFRVLSADDRGRLSQMYNLRM
jgi:hypothetical protein